MGQTPKNLRSPVNTVFQSTNASSQGKQKTSIANNTGSIVRLPQYTPDSQKFAAAMVAAVTSPPSDKRHFNHTGQSGIVAVNGSISSDSHGSAILGKNNTPIRVDAH